jgi:hypothetical protein
LNLLLIAAIVLPLNTPFMGQMIICNDLEPARDILNTWATEGLPASKMKLAELGRPGQDGEPICGQYGGPMMAIGRAATIAGLEEPSGNMVEWFIIKIKIGLKEFYALSPYPLETAERGA